MSALFYSYCADSKTVDMVIQMKTVAFIPVKMNNERTPGKNTKLFSDGTPLIYFVQNTLLQLKSDGIIDDIYIFCSNKAIKKYMLKGVDLIVRPDWLDDQLTLGKQIYTEFVNRVKSDIYVLSHATSPFVTADHYRECILKVQSGNFDSAFCSKKLQNFLWKDGAPMNFELTNPIRTQDMKPIYMELSSPYVFTRDVFRRFNSRTGENPYIVTCSEIESIDIDYPEDFALADTVYMNMLRKGTNNEKN